MPEQHVFTGAAAIGKGHIASRHAQRKEDQADDQCAGMPPGWLYDGPHPVPHGRRPGGQAGSKASFIPGGIQQQAGILPPCVPVGIQKHSLVAAQLQIVRAFAHGDPHQGVEPAHSGAEHQKKLGGAVFPAYVDQLMAKNQPQLLRGIGPLRQDHPQGPAEQADGQGRRHLCRDHQPELWLFHPGRPDLLPPQLQHGRVAYGISPRKDLLPEPQVRDGFPEQYSCKSREPDPGQHPDPAAGQAEHRQRLRHRHIALHGDVQIVGDHPKHRAGPGADMPSEKGERKHQYGIIQADVQKNAKAHGKSHLHRESRSFKNHPQNQQGQKTGRQQHSGDEGRIALLFFRGSFGAVFLFVV